jgi:hypothetical protein
MKKQVKFKDRHPDEKVILAEKLVDIGEKSQALYIELEESLRFERCTYHVVEMEGYPVRFMLIEIATKKELAFGPAERIHSRLRMRNIPDHEVYNLNIINKQH